MRNLKRLGSAVTLAAALGALSCKESTTPTTADPTTMASTVSSLNSSFSQNAVFQSLGAILGNVTLAPAMRPLAPAALPGVAGRGAALAEAGRQLALLRSLAERAPTGALALFPANVLGHTFQWDTAGGGRYRIVDSTLTGAPSNGVRFTLYAVDTATGRPRLPLTTTGYVDLSDVSTAQANVLHIVLHVGSQTAADYTVTEVKTTSSLSLSATGYVQDVVSAGPQITFTLSHVLTLADSSLATNYTAQGNGATLTMTTNITGTSRNPSESFDWTLSKNGSVEVSGTSNAAGETVQFKLNGTVFATLTETVGGQPSFTGPGGRALTTTEIAALLTIVEGFGAMWLNLTLVFGPSLLFFV